MIMVKYKVMFTTALMISVLIYKWYDLRNLMMIKINLLPIRCQSQNAWKITAWYFFKEETKFLPLLDNKTVVEKSTWVVKNWGSIAPLLASKY